MNLLTFCSNISKLPTTIGKNNVYTTQIYRVFCRSNLDVNTNVVKDVILYKSDYSRFFKMVNIFGIVQFGFWTYLSLTAFKTLKDIPIDNTKETVWWRKVNLGESRWRNSLTIISFTVGWGILALTWLYTLRSVRYLILRKGGKELTIVTYGPFGKNKMFTLDLNNVSSKEARAAGKPFIPIKVKGHYFHYMVDTRGEFRSPVLFDHTAGLKRAWTK